MKLHVLSLAAALLVFAAVAGHAGPSQTLGVNAGMAAPTGDLSNAVGAGYYAGACYAYRFNPPFAIGLDINYLGFGEKSVGSPLTGSAKEKLAAGQGALFGKYFIPLQHSPIEPYVKLGLDNFRMEFQTTATYRGVSQTQTNKQAKPGVEIGVGATRALNDRSSLGLELMYGQIQTNHQASDLLTIGLGYTYRVGK